MFEAFALVWQTAQNGRLHETGATYYNSCMYPTNSAWPAFLMPILLLLPVSFPRFYCTPQQSVPTLRYTRRHLPSVVPWISEDRLLFLIIVITTHLVLRTLSHPPRSGRSKQCRTSLCSTCGSFGRLAPWPRTCLRYGNHQGAWLRGGCIRGRASRWGAREADWRLWPPIPPGWRCGDSWPPENEVMLWSLSAMQTDRQTDPETD